MRLCNWHQEKSPQLMIIPMIDIMFFLLVFFMISTLYMVEQNVLPVALPMAAASQNDRDHLVPITVTEQGKVLVNQEEIPRELLLQRIKAEIGRNGDTGFVLRGDRQSNYGQVIAILDDLKQAGVQRVAVATELKP
jgi:biopolymer transport protein ExbD